MASVPYLLCFKEVNDFAIFILIFIREKDFTMSSSYVTIMSHSKKKGFLNR
jgi:hypothetical protein